MPFKRVFRLFWLVMMLVVAGTVTARSQTKKKNVKKPPAAVQTVTAANKPEEPKVEPPPDAGQKRNSRPVTEPRSQPAVTQAKPDPLYTYEFTQPDFLTTRILIEHDEKGRGTIAFSRRGNSETFTEPLSISDAVVAKLNAAFTDLNFLDSTENYQHEKDFSHLGVTKISLTRGPRTRSVTINYTVNKNAKILVDEYRKIANQALWIFDVTIARENQPLDGPSQMDALDALLKRNEISDPQQLLPFLRGLADDERLPLIARNHATRIIQQIEKAKK
jgi:hypothetical protein